jgi:hypothetical protein
MRSRTTAQRERRRFLTDRGHAPKLVKVMASSGCPKPIRWHPSGGLCSLSWDRSPWLDVVGGGGHRGATAAGQDRFRSSAGWVSPLAIVGFATRDDALLGRSAISAWSASPGFIALHLGSRVGLGSADIKLGCSHPGLLRRRSTGPRCVGRHRRAVAVQSMPCQGLRTESVPPWALRTCRGFHMTPGQPGVRTGARGGI